LALGSSWLPAVGRAQAAAANIATVELGGAFLFQGAGCNV
jgi:hypothetical protein